MVDRQIRTFDVTDAPLLARFLAVPRELFLPAELGPLAYSDMALRLKTEPEGARTLLAPLVLARLLQGAGIGRGDRILDVAAANGYSTALLAGLGSEVVALESAPDLFRSLRANLDGFGLTDVKAVNGPLQAGVPDAGPFDVIVVNGGVQAQLEGLIGQLAPRGRLVAIRMQGAGHAARFERIGGEVSTRVLFDAAAPVLPSFGKMPSFVF